MVKREEFYYKSADEITTIHAMKWMPETTIPLQGVVQICHGMTEYIERYDELAEYLCEQGFVVVGQDLLGHGKSVMNKNCYGYFSELNGNWKLISDIFRLSSIVKRSYPGKPYFILGHSFGSLLVRQYMVRFHDDVDGVILMGTMNRTTLEAKLGRFLAGVIAKQKKEGNRYRSAMLNDIAIGAFDKPFVEEGIRNSWLTRDAAIVKEYNAQPECNFIFTVGAYRDLFDGILEVNKRSYLKRIDKKKPILLLSGTKDPVGNMGKGVRKLYNTYKKYGINVRMKLYKEARHELIHEQQREMVFEDITKWLRKNS